MSAFSSPFLAAPPSLMHSIAKSFFSSIAVGPNAECMEHWARSDEERWNVLVMSYLEDNASSALSLDSNIEKDLRVIRHDVDGWW